MRRPIRRLLFVTDAPGFGGAERYILDMARAARRRGIEPHIFWAPLPESDPDTFAKAGGSEIPLTAVEPVRTASFRRWAGALRAVTQLHAPDAMVINACGRPRFWSTAWLARRSGIPAVWVHHMVEGRDHRRLAPQWLGGRMEGLSLWRVRQALRHRLAAAAATAVITSNERDRESIIRWQGVPASRIQVIPPGVDVERFRFDTAAGSRLRGGWLRDQGCAAACCDEPLVIGTAGRLIQGKGADRLIEATALLVRDNVNVLAVIAGYGPQRETLTSLTQARGITNRVRFIDFVSDMPAFYSALDVFVLCSESESFGLTLTEAMACGRPVAATPTAGARLQVLHGITGCQLQGFSPGELARALAGLAAAPRQREQMGRQGRRRAESVFNIELTLDRTLAALGNPAGRSASGQRPAPSLSADVLTCASGPMPAADTGECAVV